ncbi:uncharacterized protein LOC143289909 [Babylonia areolata]|uniref:uncharacterized protein LOC143289909 n=1 Tax=Babylonia areolata TaxID=304850 RepID=UPI003FCF7677
MAASADDTCSVCLAAAQDPRRVPCGNGHVFCLGCLQGLVTHGRNVHHSSFPCPVCRNPVNIPPGGVAAFPSEGGDGGGDGDGDGGAGSPPNPHHHHRRCPKPSPAPRRSFGERVRQRESRPRSAQADEEEVGDPGSPGGHGGGNPFLPHTDGNPFPPHPHGNPFLPRRRRGGNPFHPHPHGNPFLPHPRPQRRAGAAPVLAAGGSPFAEPEAETDGPEPSYRRHGARPGSAPATPFDLLRRVPEQASALSAILSGAQPSLSSSSAPRVHPMTTMMEEQLRGFDQARGRGRERRRGGFPRGPSRGFDSSKDDLDMDEVMLVIAQMEQEEQLKVAEREKEQEVMLLVQNEINEEEDLLETLCLP